MIFQTVMPIKKQPDNQIDYHSKVFLIGSCFSENIAEKFNYFKFQTSQNPFGIVFHVKAIETIIEKAVHGYVYSEDALFYNNERWHCFDAHSLLSDANKDVLLQKLNAALLATKKQLAEASHIICTLGTSWVYQTNEADTIVANCHKVPQENFTKKILSITATIQSLQRIEALVKTVNKNASFIYTVSPVRHLKDGFVENSQSKAHIIAAIHHVISEKNKSYYFPAYEIVLDQLRDYRFFKDDMVHPNQTAITYIWERFVKAWFSDKSLEIMQEIDTIQKGLNHKPFNSKSLQYQDFLKILAKKKENLQKDFPYIIFK